MTTQGNNLIVVEIPGDSQASLVDTVKRQAQLRFRLVACTLGRRPVRPAGRRHARPAQEPIGRARGRA